MGRFGQKAETRFAVLIGDVVDSRTVRARSDLQQGLLAELERLNGELFDGLAAPLALTGGDEVQGLFIHPQRAVDVVVALADAIHPERLVFGLGLGTVATEIQENVARIDGPAFHAARSALEGLRGDQWLSARGFSPEDDQVLTSLFSLMGSLRARWTRKQSRYGREARHRPQKEVAEKFRVADSTISESLKSASFSTVLEGEAAARLLLEKFGSKAETEPISEK